MDKRYQVFISSTFADLKDERAKVIQTIMELDCIPAGMEIFPAIDDDQFNFIKKVIDDCDYYILIIGGRYGSLSDDGISYTEKEFDYALEKGIKVIAFIHGDPENIPLSKSETSAESRNKLEDFRSKASGGRLVKFWKNAEELPGLVALSLPKTIKTYPAIGWVRANTVGNPELLHELNELRKENQTLKDQLSILDKTSEVSKNNGAEELAGFDDLFHVNGKIALTKWEVDISWREIFYIISPFLMEHPNDAKVSSLLSKELHKRSGVGGNSLTPWINEEDFYTIRIQLAGLNLINVKYTQATNGTSALFWSLTEKGKEKMIEIRTVKKNKSE